jgi:hypothetical protein
MLGKQSVQQVKHYVLAICSSAVSLVHVLDWCTHHCVHHGPVRNAIDRCSCAILHARWLGPVWLQPLGVSRMLITHGIDESTAHSSAAQRPTYRSTLSLQHDLNEFATNSTDRGGHALGAPLIRAARVSHKASGPPPRGNQAKREWASR